MKDEKNILEVYKKRRYNELLIEKRAKIAEVEKEDKFQQLVDEYNKNVNELLVTEGRNTEVGDYDVVVYTMSDATKKAIEEIETAFKDKMDDRDRIIEEVKALEMLCDCTEEYEALYKKFGILDKDGKIYDYKK